MSVNQFTFWVWVVAIPYWKIFFQPYRKLSLIRIPPRETSPSGGGRGNTSVFAGYQSANKKKTYH